MKLSRHAFTRFWDVHAWSGVLGGIVLHVMFFAGAFALFREELASWQERAPRAAPAAARPLAPLLDAVLRDAGARPTDLALHLPTAHHPFLEVSWPEPGRPDWKEIHVDPASGGKVAPSSQLATILYWLHFLHHPRVSWGMYVAGVFGVALLLALVTGVLIHLKDLARQFHQFRPARRTKVLWSDMHKVLGVMGLPFQLTLAFTGALLCLATPLLTAFAGPVFGGDQAAASAAMWGGGRDGKAAGRPGPNLDVDTLIRHARAAVPGFEPRFVRLHHRGDEDATARVWGDLPGTMFARGDVILRARDGAVESQSLTAAPTPGAAVTRWVVGLHYALYGGLLTKVLYALLAAATCLTLLTGNWIWLSRREARSASAGNRLLAALTIGFGGGVIPATAALFWANRIAPAPARAAAEAWAFFGVWALTTLLFLVRAERRGGWVGLLRLAGAGFLLLPVASALGTHAHLLNFGRHGRLDVLGVETGLALLGLALLAAATIVRRGERGGARPARATAAVPAPNPPPATGVHAASAADRA